MKNPPRCSYIILPLIALSLALPALNGCRTSRGKLDITRPLTKSQLSTFLSNSKDPREYWITVYRADDGPVFTGANRIHPNQLVSLEFVSDKETTSPIIEVMTRFDQELFALIDTSAQESWMDFKSLVMTQAVPIGRPVFTTVPLHVPQQYAGYLTVVSKLIFDYLHMETSLFYAPALQGPLQQLARMEQDPLPNMVISYETLKSFRYVRFDFQARTITLSTTLPYKPNEDRILAGARLVDKARIAATDGLLDGKKQRLVLDTAGDFELILPDNSTDMVRQLFIGDLVISKIKPGTAEEHRVAPIPYPRVGRKILENFVVTFDFKLNLITFERPLKGKEKAPISLHPKLGIRPE